MAARCLFDQPGLEQTARASPDRPTTTALAHSSLGALCLRAPPLRPCRVPRAASGWRRRRATSSFIPSISPAYIFRSFARLCCRYGEGVTKAVGPQQRTPVHSPQFVHIFRSRPASPFLRPLACAQAFGCVMRLPSACSSIPSCGRRGAPRPHSNQSKSLARGRPARPGRCLAAPRTVIAVDFESESDSEPAETGSDSGSAGVSERVWVPSHSPALSIAALLALRDQMCVCTNLDYFVELRVNMARLPAFQKPTKRHGFTDGDAANATGSPGRESQHDNNHNWQESMRIHKRQAICVTFGIFSLPGLDRCDRHRRSPVEGAGVDRVRSEPD